MFVPISRNVKLFALGSTFIGLIGISSSASAVTIPFSNDDLSESTTTGFMQITDPGISPTLIPGDSTFTEEFDQNIPSGNQGKWYRYDFSLPENFTEVCLHILLSVDNEVQLFLNDQTIAVEDDTSTANFNAPYPEFSLNADGSVTNTSATWDSLPISQSMFQVGNNELTFFATNNGGPGNFVLNPGDATGTDGSFVSYEINGQEPPNGIPVPTTIALLGLGLAGLGFARRKKE